MRHKYLQLQSICMGMGGCAYVSAYTPVSAPVDLFMLLLCAACLLSVVVLMSIGQTQLGSNKKASVQLLLPACWDDACRRLFHGRLL